ncbi:MAG: NAD-dependent epimerase/dehydratase family protein, partial [Rubripirellula sp.]
MIDDSRATATVFITGGFGCVGAETAKWLISNSVCDVVVGSRRISRERKREVFGEAVSSRLKFAQVDVVDRPRLHATLVQYDVTHVLHLAGLETPDCNEHRDLGLQVNLAGTQRLIEAMKVSGRDLKRFVFASSMAVYGRRSAYAAGRVPMHAEPNP